MDAAPPPSERRRVASELTRRVRSMQPGDEIGSVRSLAAEHGVSADVARKALALLVEHGLVRAEARRHVVADPDAPLGLDESVEDLRQRVADLERSRHEQADRLDELEARLAAALAAQGLAYGESNKREHQTG